MRVKLRKIGLQLLRHSGSAREVIRGAHVTLDFAKDDFYLVQPTGIGGQPVETPLEAEVQGGAPRRQLLGGVGGTIVQAEMKHLEPPAEDRSKESTQESLEVGKT